MFFQLSSNNPLNNLRHKRQVRNRVITLWVIRVETRFLDSWKDQRSLLTGRNNALPQRCVSHGADERQQDITNSSMTLVGSGSSGQLLGDALSRNSRSSSSETSRNDVNCCPVYTVNDGDTQFSVAARTASTFSTKNCDRLFADSEGLGAETYLLRFKIHESDFHNFLEFPCVA